MSEFILPRMTDNLVPVGDYKHILTG